MRRELTEDEAQVLAERGFRYMITPSCVRYGHEDYWHMGWDVVAVCDGAVTYREARHDLPSAISHGLYIETRRGVSPIDKPIPPSWLNIELPATRLSEFAPLVAAIEAAGIGLIPGAPRNVDVASHPHDDCEPLRRPPAAAEWTL